MVHRVVVVLMRAGIGRPAVAATLVTLGLVTTLTACGDEDASRRPSGGSAGTLVEVVTTTILLTNFAEEVGGSHVNVYGVLKANVDPHDYEPSPADLNQIREADVLIKNGVGLEKWFDDSIESADPQGEVVDASSHVDVRTDDGSDEQATGDPHIWHNPRNAIVMIHDIAQAFEKADPAHRAAYRRNEARYVEQLKALDKEVEAKVGKLSNRKIVTNHDAFGYYVDRYGLDFVGSIIPSFDTQAELSAQDIRRIVARIRSTGVKAVFSESSLPAKTANTIGRDAGVRVVAGEDALYGDSLGPPGSAGDTYLKMIRHNTKEIVDNLS